MNVKGILFNSIDNLVIALVQRMDQIIPMIKQFFQGLNDKITCQLASGDSYLKHFASNLSSFPVMAEIRISRLTV